METADIIVIGAGSAGCAAVGALAQAGLRDILVLEAGPTDAHPLVRAPLGLIWLMGSRRDWSFSSAPQTGAAGRNISVPRGKVVGGSGSINSMVWFRGARADYDAWGLPGWGSNAVWDRFTDLEAVIAPRRLADAHPLTEALGRVTTSDAALPPDPECVSTGVFHTNMRDGRRWSAADAWLRPAISSGAARLRTGAEVDRLIVEEGRAVGVRLVDGTELRARGGVLLTAGAIASPAILMRSGLGPGEHLREIGVEVLADLPGVGDNLHDHPAVGLFHEGAGSGRGLTWDQLPAWALSPFQWLLTGRGRIASNTVEGGAFLRAEDGDGPPDFQVHFLPARIGHDGAAIGWGAGYFADVNLCQPKSRGRLTLASRDPRTAPNIDFGLFSDPADLPLLTRGLRKLRALLDAADFGDRRAEEVFPGRAVDSDEDLADYIRTRCGTSYHPVGTVRMGGEEAAPLTPELALKGISHLWVADASSMTRITTANTNAPSMLIGAAGGEAMAQRLKG